MEINSITPAKITLFPSAAPANNVLILEMFPAEVHCAFAVYLKVRRLIISKYFTGLILSNSC